MLDLTLCPLQLTVLDNVCPSVSFVTRTRISMMTVAKISDNEQLIIVNKSHMYAGTISMLLYISKKMLFFILFSLTFLLCSARTRQLSNRLDNLLLTENHPPNIAGMTTNYNYITDPYDVDYHGGHFDYTYQARDHPSAVYHLLNFIDQSVPSVFKTLPPVPSSKYPILPATPQTIISSNVNSSQNNNLNRYQNYYNNNNNHHHQHHQAQHHNGRHHKFASQASASSIPNYINNDWSRKQRNHQVHWRHQNNKHRNLDSNKPSMQILLDNANSIDTNAPALKIVKSSYLNTHPLPMSTSKQQNNGQSTTTSSTLSNSKVPHDIDSEMIAATHNGPRCDKFTPDICVDDFEYPEQAIIDEIQKKRDVFELMYSEVKDNEPLVDGIPRDIEESYNYSVLQGAASSMSSSPPSPPTSAGSIYSRSSSIMSSTDHEPVVDGMDALIGAISSGQSSANMTGSATSASLSQQSPPTSGFICPSEVMYGKPKLAKNKKGQWKVIVNAGEFTQTVRLEKCLQPNKKCNYISPNFESRCAQVHSYHRLLVFEKGRGFHIDTFRLPTGCSCHVTKKQTASSRVSSASNSNGFTQTDSSNGPMEADSNDGNGSSIGGIGSGAGGGGITGGGFNNGGRTTSSINGAISNGYNVSSMSAERVHPPSSSVPHGQRANLSQHSLSSAGALSDINQFNQLKYYSNFTNDLHNQIYHQPRIPSAPSHETSMLSQTLWSILSNGGGSGNAASGGGMSTGGISSQSNNYNSGLFPASTGFTSAQSRQNVNNLAANQANDLIFNERNQQQDAYQAQSIILNHLSHNPSLAANISDSVLRQLLGHHK